MLHRRRALHQSRTGPWQGGAENLVGDDGGAPRGFMVSSPADISVFNVKQLSLAYLLYSLKRVSRNKD